MSLYPLLVKWSNSLSGLPGASDDWNSSYRIFERKPICTDQDFGVDASVFMMAHAYNVANYSEKDGVYPENICIIRNEIRDAIVMKEYPMLSTRAPPSTNPPPATIPSTNVGVVSKLNDPRSTPVNCNGGK